MPETDLQAVTSGVEAALGSTAETAHSFWEKYLGANALSKIIARRSCSSSVWYSSSC